MSDAPRTIDADDPAALERWAQRLGVDVDAVRNAVIAVGPTARR
jgi:sugar diacid utilization regulator